MKKSEEKIKTSIYLTPDIIERLKEKADEESRSLNNLVVFLLKQSLAK